MTSPKLPVAVARGDSTISSASDRRIRQVLGPLRTPRRQMNELTLGMVFGPGVLDPMVSLTFQIWPICPQR